MDINIIIFLLFAIILLIIFYKNSNCGSYQQSNNNENFMANTLYNHTNINTTHENRLYGRYLKTSEFMNMVKNIKQIIYDCILDMAQSCITMNGSPSWNNGLTQISLQCFMSDHEIEKNIVGAIDKYIYSVMKNKFNINMNSQHIIHDLMRNLNLLEKVIYPLKYSNLYTKNGEQYTTEKKIYSLVYDLNIKDSLISTLERRDILLEIDNDEHIF
jgi:hypothetical protein